jgi:SulP family sulfate permease
LRHWTGDFSGAFADLGTFLPLMIGVFAVQRLDPTGVLAGFGVFALAVALIYRRPVPVQPMKAVAAVVIAGGFTASAVTATGILVGLVLSVLAVTGAVGLFARVIPKSVLTGVQLGVGLYLASAGGRLMIQEPAIGAGALAVLLVLQRSALKPLAALIVVLGAGVWGATRAGVVMPALSPGLSLPQLQLPDWSGVWIAFKGVLLPQLALTVTNAAVITAAISAELFPQDRQRITPDRLAFTSGALNVVLAPLGAFPMCHGAGGLVVQHRFGARTGLAPAIFGVTCLSLAVLFGPRALTLLSILPLAAVGSLLVVAGAELALSKRLLEARADCLIVILATGLGCVVMNVAVGLIAGLFLEWLRALVVRWKRNSDTL